MANIFSGLFISVIDLINKRISVDNNNDNKFKVIKKKKALIMAFLEKLFISLVVIKLLKLNVIINCAKLSISIKNFSYF